MENITPDYVDEEIKQLLYDKGFRFLLEDIQLEEGGHLRANYSLAEQRWNEGNLSYIDDLTIAIVVKWLYLKHNIWITVERNEIKSFIYWEFCIDKGFKVDDRFEIQSQYFWKTPEQAYLEAIKYTLTKLI
jgi:hypothetical protein